MKKAVLCIAHKAPEQLNVLARQILADCPDSDIYFHIDKKAERIKADIMQHPNVHFIQNSHSITWGDDSTVDTLVDAFDEIVSLGKEYDYFQICTGQDLMVKPGLSQFLEENRGKIYMDIAKNDKYVKGLLLYPYPPFLRKDFGTGVMFYVMLAYTMMIRIGLVPKKKIRYDYKKLDFFTSYNWSFMPYEVICYIDRFIKENPDFMDLCRGACVPEDGFLATIIMNSPYRDRVVILEETHRGTSMTYMKPFSGPHPPFLTIEDVPVIRDSGCFMARKFDISKNPDVVSYYENLIVGDKKAEVVL